ncbi:YitT family protein [Enterococcus sp. LJL90]
MSLIKRQLFSAIGAAIVGIGVGLCVLTGFGADALGLLWQGVANVLPLTVGQASLCITGICLVIVFFIDKKELGLSTIINPLVTSLVTDWTIQTVQLPQLKVLLLLILIFGISLIGIGNGLASATNTGKEGYIALSFGISQKLHFDLAKVRSVMDLICFILGMILGGGLMIGPILGVILIGPLLKRSNQFCFQRFKFLANS